MEIKPISAREAHKKMSLLVLLFGRRREKMKLLSGLARNLSKTIILKLIF
jgi:hypothetical protein